MLSGFILVVGISALILIHELGHFIAAKKAGLLVQEFGFGFPPRMFSIKKGETIYSFNWLPFGGFVKIYGESKAEELVNEDGTPSIDPKRSFAHQSAWSRITIIAAGVAMNFFLGWFITSAVFMIGAPQSVVITAIGDKSPAQVAGLKEGDILKGYTQAADFIQFVEAHRGKEITLDVLSGGKERNVVVTPRVQNVDGQGPVGVVLADAGFPRMGFFESLKQGLITSVSIMAEIFKAFGGLIAGLFGQGAGLNNVVGPVGIFGVAGQLGQIGLIYLLQMIGMISLNLAVINIIPFPALDGGRLLFIIIEKIKGSPIAPKKEMVANLVGFGLLLLLMIVITTHDILKLI